MWIFWFILFWFLIFVLTYYYFFLLCFDFFQFPCYIFVTNGRTYINNCYIHIYNYHIHFQMNRIFNSIFYYIHDFSLFRTLDFHLLIPEIYDFFENLRFYFIWIFSILIFSHIWNIAMVNAFMSLMLFSVWNFCF